METTNHLLLTNHLSAGVRAALAVRVAVGFGSIFPDLNVFTYLRGNHTFENTCEKVRAKLRALLDKPRWNLVDIWQFGQVIHYAGDFFTHSHSPGYRGGKVKHYFYEKALRGEMRRYLAEGTCAEAAAFPPDADDICGDLESRYRIYCAAEQSIEWDCICITAVTARMVKTFWALAEQRCSDVVARLEAMPELLPELLPPVLQHPLPIPVLREDSAAG